MSTTELVTGAVIAIIVLAVAGLMRWHRAGMQGEQASAMPRRAASPAPFGQEPATQTIVPLNPQLREHFVGAWQKIQAQYADDPAYAVTRADDQLREVLTARGFAVGRLDAMMDALSRERPDISEHYRKVHEIGRLRRCGAAGSEHLRIAMTHYRVLFDDLVNEPEVRRNPDPAAWPSAAARTR
ncbi:hypothetical protein [Novosphingobium album (ex Liu et al. 2023)]|uniref:Secreted protein n=1 Tax=Novosphingobium album (ex Liu et al. 2023) TaxID=3031130 RepID=A0ABT5WQE0_9SPHN|nr:hypothetical protein [Novosphingobium album (ex Liu et al. 2023)]MDE8652094.1 hypothetical protein [Novosphingobium album (ex Liu et al. 2023)]